MFMSSSDLAPVLQERRAHPRVRLHTTINLTSQSNFYTGLTGDISEGGVFVATHNVFSPGTSVDLEFTLPDNGGAIIARGEVRWAAEYNELSDGPPGLGIKFLDLSERDRARIERFVRTRDTMLYDE
jgi:uncharacterized protein (TIGR02266 family)